MPVVTFSVIAVSFIILLALNSFLRKSLKHNEFNLKSIQNSTNEILKRLKTLEDNFSKSAPQSPINEQAEKPIDQKTHAVTPKTEDISIREKVIEQSIEDTEDKATPETEKSKTPPTTIKPTQLAAVNKVEITEVQPREKRKSFIQRHPDIEKFIGENLINKIGIVILVLGIGFFVKYAIDKNWINEIARVAIGILCASGLLGLAHKLRKDYKPFSSVLIGGGLAVLYYTITLAYHTQGYPFYQQQTLTFAILIMITVFAVFLSISYDRIEIAILAILGGFCSPLLLSSGSGNYITLFSYIMLLNTGMLVLSYYKKWRLVNIVSFAFTVILFTIWLGDSLFRKDYDPFNGAIIFASGFYIIFFLMNIIYNLKHKIEFKAIDISLLLSNTFIYFAFMMIMLNHISDGMYKGLFAVLLGVFNFGFAWFTKTRQNIDAKLLFLLIGLVFTFITLAVPLQLQGNYITLFWAVESVLLLWLGLKSGFKILQLGSAVVCFLLLISIVMDWVNNYNIVSFYNEDYVKELRFVFNKMFITTLIASFSLIASLLIIRDRRDKIAWIFPVPVYRALSLAALLIIFYVGGLLEVNYHAIHEFIESSSKSVTLYTYNALYVLLILFLSFKIKNKALSIVSSSISVLFLLFFLTALTTHFSRNISAIISLEETQTTLLLIFRWTSILTAYAIAFLTSKLVTKTNNYSKANLYKLNIMLLVSTVIFLLSADLDAISILISKSTDILYQSQKIGYTILWGISSFVLMLIGMKKKIQIIRIYSLALFAITIGKLFIYDISNISEGGKIIAFILLGVLLLIMSFMYQKLKKLVVEDNLSQDNKTKPADTSNE